MLLSSGLLVKSSDDSSYEQLMITDHVSRRFVGKGKSSEKAERIVCVVCV